MTRRNNSDFARYHLQAVDALSTRYGIALTPPL